MPVPGTQPSTYTDTDVVHLVGQLTPVVLSYLVPAANALADAGFRQTIVVVAPEADHSLTQPLRDSIHVDWHTGKHSSARWRSGLHALAQLVLHAHPTGMHMHGFVPFALGGITLRKHGYTGNLFYSPHGSRAHGKHSTLGLLAYALVSPWVGGRSFLVIADETGDPARTLPGSKEVVEAVPTPIPEHFFNLDHIEAPEPVVVGGAAEATLKEVTEFCQLAVMLPTAPGDGAKVHYYWIGPTNAQAREVLKSACIDVVLPSDVKTKLEVLSTAWAYVAPAHTRGFPIHLAEAMSAAVPCVAVAAPEHTQLLQLADPKLAYATLPESLQFLNELLSNPAKRKNLGETSRTHMRAWRTELEFGGRVVPLYRNQHTQTAETSDREQRPVGLNMVGQRPALPHMQGDEAA